MPLKNIVLIFGCTALNLFATTQETQTDPLPGIYQLPAVQPICFSGKIVSTALQAAQIREQALRTSILAEEAKGLEYLMKNRFYTLWNQRIVDLSAKEKQLEVNGNIAVVFVYESKLLSGIRLPNQTIMILSKLNNNFIHDSMYRFPASPYYGNHTYEAFITQALDHRFVSIQEGVFHVFYLTACNNQRPFFGQLKEVPHELQLKANFRQSRDGDNRNILEPIEGEYHVDEEGRMMPMFTLVSEKKTEEEMKQN